MRTFGKFWNNGLLNKSIIEKELQYRFEVLLKIDPLIREDYIIAYIFVWDGYKNDVGGLPRKL